MKYVTMAEMKELDRRTIEECGIPAEQLMENAGIALAAEAMKILEKGRVEIFAGYGNNGGDGFVTARYLLEKCYEVTLILVGKAKPMTAESDLNLKRFLDHGGKTRYMKEYTDIAKIFSESNTPDLIIDAIFGIGIKGELDKFYIKLIEEINGLGIPIISADIPSGLDADTGRPLGAAIKAVKTVTFGHPKIGFKGPRTKRYTGELIVADIGLGKF